MAPQQQSKQQVQLKELGAKLESRPSSKDSLLKLLKQGAGILAEVDQSPPEPILESMQPFLKAVVKPELQVTLATPKEIYGLQFCPLWADHPESVLSSMKTIMVALIEESEEITEDLLLILLSTVGQNRKDTPKAARKLVMGVIEND
ncbi:hypothetical protein Droror1_Dr00019380 [Drosera rotundifolia]